MVSSKRIIHAADLTAWHSGMKTLEFDEFASSIETLTPRAPRPRPVSDVAQPQNPGPTLPPSQTASSAANAATLPAEQSVDSEERNPAAQPPFVPDGEPEARVTPTGPRLGKILAGAVAAVLIVGASLWLYLYQTRGRTSTDRRNAAATESTSHTSQSASLPAPASTQATPSSASPSVQPSASPPPAISSGNATTPKKPPTTRSNSSQPLSQNPLASNSAVPLLASEWTTEYDAKDICGYRLQKKQQTRNRHWVDEFGLDIVRFAPYLVHFNVVVAADRYGLPINVSGIYANMEIALEIGTEVYQGTHGSPERNVPFGPNNSRQQLLFQVGANEKALQTAMQLLSENPVATFRVTNGPRPGETVTIRLPHFSKQFAQSKCSLLRGDK